MINLENIPGGMISGLDSEVLDWVSEESNYRNVVELGESFAREISESDSFPEIDPSVLRQLDLLESEGIPKSTACKTY